MEAVVDASAFVKLLVEESGSGRVDEIEASSQLLAPDWLLAEVATALWKKVRRGLLTSEQAIEALTEAERYDVELVPAAELLPGALALACEIPHPPYDVLYLLLAMHGGRPLVTADERMRQAAEELGVRVEWVGTTGSQSPAGQRDLNRPGDHRR